MQIAALEDDIEAQLTAHPDAHMFTSLPQAGIVRAARLLAEIGDCRSRFPTVQALTTLAGAAPSTRQSGKAKVVGRHAHPRQSLAHGHLAMLANHEAYDPARHRAYQAFLKPAA
jgi:transposase